MVLDQGDFLKLFFTATNHEWIAQNVPIPPFHCRNQSPSSVLLCTSMISKDFNKWFYYIYIWQPGTEVEEKKNKENSNLKQFFFGSSLEIEFHTPITWFLYPHHLAPKLLSLGLPYPVIWFPYLYHLVPIARYLVPKPPSFVSYNPSIWFAGLKIPAVDNQFYEIQDVSSQVVLCDRASAWTTKPKPVENLTDDYITFSLSIREGSDVFLAVVGSFRWQGFFF